jgi:AcrR family transcriptional regulator
MPACRRRPADDRPLRADALRNRQRILSAAKELFARKGLSVPMEEIARHAGVGVGTLYRRFPTRPDLIAAAFEGKVATYADYAEEACAADEPWPAFCAYVEKVCEMQAQDCGFASALTMTFPRARQFQAERARAYKAASELIRRAKEAGDLREDFVFEDLVLLLVANAGVIAATGDTVPGAWRRVTEYMIQAFSTRNRGHLPAAPAPAAMYRALFHLKQ